MCWTWQDSRPKLTGLVFCISALAANHLHATDMNLEIQVTGLDAKGITLVSPVNANFDSLIRSLFKGNSNELLKLKPFMTVIRNSSAHTVVAYTTAWTMRKHGRTSINYSQHKYPDAVARTAPDRRDEIRPGELRIDVMSVELESGEWGHEATDAFYLRQFANWSAEEKTGMTELRIELDAVIFDDGLLIGPDRSRLRDHFAAYLKAKQDLYRKIVEALDSGHSVEKAFRPVTLTLSSRPDPDPGDEFAIYPHLAAEDAALWRRRYGDQAVQKILKQALRKEPFVIRRQEEP